MQTNQEYFFLFKNKVRTARDIHGLNLDFVYFMFSNPQPDKLLSRRNLCIQFAERDFLSTQVYNVHVNN